MATLLVTREDYKDLDLSFKFHPAYADIVPVVELDAIKNAMRIILLTNPGEKPFKPDFGAGVSEYLFENFNPLVAEQIKFQAERAFKLYEPRIEVNNIDVIDNIDRNALEITIQATIVNYEVEFEVTTLLERVR